MSSKTNYEEYYASEDYYWGIEPAELCYELLKLLPPGKDVKVLDIGCGEGKDAVFMAKQGYQVTAFDITKNGIAKSDGLSVPVTAFCPKMIWLMPGLNRK